MASTSPFEFALRLPAVEALAGGRVHIAIDGLLGAARPLITGAVGLAQTFTPKKRGAKTKVVLLVVDGPEAALDAVGDLRAFLAAEEALGNRQKLPPRKTGTEE